MAEFCIDCMKDINKDPDAKYKYVLTRYVDLCEGCGQWKRVVISRNPFYPYNAIAHSIFLWCRKQK